MTEPLTLKAFTVWLISVLSMTMLRSPSKFSCSGSLSQRADPTERETTSVSRTTFHLLPSSSFLAGFFCIALGLGGFCGAEDEAAPSRNRIPE